MNRLIEFGQMNQFINSLIFSCEDLKFALQLEDKQVSLEQSTLESEFALLSQLSIKSLTS